MSPLDENAVIGAVAEPHPEGNPALAAAVQAILNRRLAASHGMGDETSRRAALLLEILPDAAVALEAVAPLLAAAERERCARLADEAARDAHAQQAEPGADRISRDSWAKALTWFAMELRSDPAVQAREIAQRAEEIHAEHHPGTFVPSLDSCTEHTRAEYEQLVSDLLRRGGSDGT